MSLTVRGRIGWHWPFSEYKYSLPCSTQSSFKSNASHHKHRRKHQDTITMPETFRSTAVELHASVVPPPKDHISTLPIEMLTQILHLAYRTSLPSHSKPTKPLSSTPSYYSYSRSVYRATHMYLICRLFYSILQSVIWACPPCARRLNLGWLAEQAVFTTWVD